MYDSSFNNSLKAGTAGGTALTILVNIRLADLGKTVLLAAVGAIVSFAVSLTLKAILKRFRR
jgi:hypothetical protein